jgi:hypothetical protein
MKPEKRTALQITKAWPKFEIEKNVPVPPPRRVPGQYKYPFRELEVGDSFFVPEAVADINKVQASAGEARRKTKWRFSVRRVEGGCRAWRTE